METSKFKEYIGHELDGSLKAHQNLLNNIEENVSNVTSLIIDSLKSGGKCLFFGNGGSAADAQHLATELVCRYRKNREAIAALALTTDTSFLTACSNDFSFDDIFSRQIEALCKKEDIAIGISTSGNSSNVLKGLIAAKKLGACTIGFLGYDGGKIKEITDHNIIIKENNTARVQECHITVGHIICGLIEESF